MALLVERRMYGLIEQDPVHGSPMARNDRYTPGVDRRRGRLAMEQECPISVSERLEPEDGSEPSGVNRWAPLKHSGCNPAR